VQSVLGKCFRHVRPHSHSCTMMAGHSIDAHQVYL
jgi:hypothetical protein